MPASLFSEMESGGRVLPDQGALELALQLTQLSMMSLGSENESPNGNMGSNFISDMEPRNKKSQNTTECVPVPSSEHVAEIVGRQGCKIKALRAKTNTYIKTPVRGEEPVFVVTGRKEDVGAAKQEILSAADHFSLIRAQRKNNLNGTLMPGPNSNIPGQTTIQVRVPYKVVGLVVGPKGATIKRIQQQTSTYIVTPSREKEPIFEVTGLPDNVESARYEIEKHIASRTGSLFDSPDDCDFGQGLLECVLSNNINANNGLFKDDLSNDFMIPYRQNSNNNLDNMFSFSSLSESAKPDPFSSVFGRSFGSAFGLYDPDEGLGGSPTFDVPATSTTSSWPDFGAVPFVDSIFSSTSASSSNSSSRSGLTDLTQRSNSVSGTLGLTDLALRDHPPARRIQSDPEVNIGDTEGASSTVSTLPFSTLINTSAGGIINFSSAPTTCSGSSSSSPTDSLAQGSQKRDCILCYENTVAAALVPCGHNVFCYDCATRVCEENEPICPYCRQPASQAIRIYCN